MKKFFNRRGQAAVEFSLLLPIFALVLFATIYIGFFVMDYVTLDNAAFETARHAAMDSGHAIRAADKTKIKDTQLFLSWYELNENDYIKSSRGKFVGDPAKFENDSSGEYIRVMIQATLKDDKKDTILGDIMPEKYTVSKVVQIED